ncbi:MAG: O-antigen ligase family protein [Thermoanaerobaculales bacterium]
MLATALKHRAAVLPLLTVAWVVGAWDAAFPPWLSAGTTLLAMGLALPALRRRPLPAPGWWFAGLLIWAAADAVLRPVASFDAGRCIAMGVTALLLGVAASTPRGAVWGRAAIVAAGLITAGWLVVERLTIAGRPGGPFANPNLGATLALLALALVPFLPLPTAPRVAAAGIAVAGIVASGSRGALLGVCAVAAVWVAARGVARLRRLAFVVVLLAAVGLALRLAIDRDPLRFERLRIWGVATRTVAAELPLGCGPGGYADAALPHNFPLASSFARYARIPDLAESDLFEVLATLGVPGAALLFGLITSVARRLVKSDDRGWGVVAAIAVTSLFSSQLIVPAVAWSAALALATVLPRRRRTIPRQRWPLLATVGMAVAVATAAVLASPDWGAGEAPDRLVDRSVAALRGAGADDARMADAEALLLRAGASRPRYGRVWRDLGALRLERARVRHERDLAVAAAAAFESARKLNTGDVWAAFGDGQALRLLGNGEGAQAAFKNALTLEPNFLGAWLELAALHVEKGELGAARVALERLASAQAKARGAVFVSEYERALVRVDPQVLGQLRRVLGALP